MTHIIGKPKPPKRGATFADVAHKHWFACLGLRFQRIGDAAYRFREDGEPSCVPIKMNQPVQLLTQPQPIDPEPDPDVCTPEKVENGAILQDSDGLCMRIFDNEHMLVDLQSGEAWTPGTLGSWRRVTASVVVHEEPGTHVMRDDDRGGARLQFWGGGEAQSSTGVSWEQLQAIVQQGAALLAAADERERQGDPGSAERDSLVQALAHDPDAMRRFNQAKPAEDRSKPAPGWEWGSNPAGYKMGRLDEDNWRSDVFSSREDAIAATWLKHDAQQAGEGGGE